MKNTEGYAALNRGTLRMLLGFVLAFALVFGLLSAAIFAETATAADMRLQSASGTVSVKNASGKSVSIREGMKLYSGYTLSTSSKSYAYASLDSTKVVKLDASTKVQVKKSGSKLELLVSSGKLFFNVSAPLSSSETLNIRTSTMVTGVRGTSGVVSAGGAESSSVDIYDGTVTVNVVSGEESLTVTAGESLSVSSTGTASSTPTPTVPSSIPSERFSKACWALPIKGAASRNARAATNLLFIYGIHYLNETHCVRKPAASRSPGSRRINIPHRREYQ